MMNQKNVAVRWLWLVLVSALLFLICVLLVRVPEVRSLDNRLIQALDPFRTDTPIFFFSKITDFGASRLLIIIIILTSLFLIYKKRFVALVLLPLAFWAERGMNSLLKHWVMRDRPDFPHLVHETGYSFPSGHAMNAATVYGLLIILIAPLIRHRPMRRLWIVLCLAMIVLIGFSRPFLRVHFFTDILAGYCMGGVFVGITALIVIFIDSRRGCR